MATVLASEEEPPDLYVVGLQEIVDLNATNLVVDHNATEAWQEHIEATFRHHYPKTQFTLLCSRHLVGIALLVWVKRDLRDMVQDLQSDTAGVGIMGVGGNKGGVAVRMRLFDSTVCFVNTHLAAHQNNVQGRNSDFHNVCKKLQFSVRSSSSSSSSSTQGGEEGKPSTIGIFAHDFVFWIGDLNYRLNVTDLGFEEVFRRLESEGWRNLLQYDQLALEKAKGNAFTRFVEAEIDFPPSYKYQVGTQLYERRPDKKQRYPAW